MTLHIATIEVSGGRAAALVDADIVSFVSGHRWYLSPGKRTAYAATTIDGRTVYMHRLIMGEPDSSIDHINGDGLDNRRVNLRLATASEQQRNSRPKGGRSRFKGVSVHRTRRMTKAGLRMYERWRAEIELPGRRRVIRYARTEIDAARLYDALALEHFGPFAKLNLASVAIGLER